ncbi:MAG: OsmC family protein [Hyphomicrobiaceae bacterium]
MKGTDLAPFPLGFFNAGLQSDLIGRLLKLAEARGISLDDVSISLQNHYWMTGSFFRGTGEGFADPATAKVKLRSSADAAAIRQLVDDAVAASPAFGAMRAALTNTFAIYVNGRRRTVETMDASTAADAPDPYTTYSSVPKPLSDNNGEDVIWKTGSLVSGDIEPAPTGTTTRIIRNICGDSQLANPAGVIETDTWLNLPGMSHFTIRSDERGGGDAGPCGLTLISAGIAFCFMTQLGRYIEHMKFDINGVRLVQYSPYGLASQGNAVSGHAGPVDTHLFLNGHADDETFERLMHIAARTCYLHATLAKSLVSEIAVELNGKDL